MNPQTRHKQLGITLSYDMTENVQAAIKQFAPAFLRDHTPNHAKELACRIHLGYASPTEDLCTILMRGADWAVEYFQRGNVREVSGGWFSPLSRGMLLCLLVDDEAKLRAISSWAKPSAKPEYKGPIADEIQLLYLVLGSLFQETPAKGFNRLVERINKCRTKEVRLLSKALDAVINRDQSKFAAAIEACVKHHASKPKPAPDAYFMEDWLPLHANAVYLAGLKLGLQPPDYPPEVAAYLMTPETVGFGDL